MSSHRLRPVAYLAVLAVALLPFLLGGWPPSWLNAESTEATSSLSLGSLIFDLSPAGLPVILLTVLGTGLAGGTRGLRGAFLFLCGVKQFASLEVHRSLSNAARVAIGSGLFFSLVAMLALLAATALQPEGMRPAEIARFLTVVLISPLVGLVLGRLVLTPAANAAAVQVHAPELARRPMTAELALFVLVVPISILFFVMVVSVS